MQVSAPQLAKKVKELRDLQKKYFKTRDITLLQSCKKTEKEVDEMVESVLRYQAQPADLFGSKIG